MIPKVYNGKNKTFFMANYEGQRTRQGIDQFYLVPTQAQLSGHFTSTIIDPTTGLPFLNDTVPSTRFSRLANLAIQKFSRFRTSAYRRETTGSLHRFQTT